MDSLRKFTQIGKGKYLKRFLVSACALKLLDGENVGVIESLVLCALCKSLSIGKDMSRAQCYGQR